ncbi:hypothetical protein DL96DRAFT_1715811 [Flagelloscypha sp. PMI_526]|nr:hypothetical protein DL96DRAFT_1715811 [Flagelloscypha sp. PMI_526]
MEMASITHDFLAQLENLAVKHGFKKEYGPKAFFQKGKGLGNERRVSIWNAKLHLVKIEAQGEKVALEELRRRAKNLDISKETAVKILAQLTAYRTEKLKGARVSNKAAAIDVRKAFAKIAKLVTAANDNPDDTMSPSILALGNAGAYLRTILNMSPWDLARAMDGFCIAQAQKKTDNSDNKSLMSEISSGLNEGLCAVLNCTMAPRMNYERYGRFVQTHSVRLIGWPENVPFIKPSGLRSRGEVLPLHRAVFQGHCRWITLSVKQAQAFAEKWEKAHPLKDKGEKRAATTSSSSAARPAKKKRKTHTKDTSSNSGGASGSLDAEEDNGQSSTGQESSQTVERGAQNEGSMGDDMEEDADDHSSQANDLQVDDSQFFRDETLDDEDDEEDREDDSVYTGFSDLQDLYLDGDDDDVMESDS